MRSALSLTLACLGLAMADNTTQLFVSSYAGNITSLRLNQSKGQYQLSRISSTSGCEPNPSWLTLDFPNKALYCLDEGLETTNGTLSSFTIEADGSLTPVDKQETISGPVSGAIFGNGKSCNTGKKGLALAHYTGSAVSSWELSLNSTPTFSNLQDIPFTLTKPGTVPDRQDAPHEHEAILDPTGQYLLVPDLGADLVRVFSYDESGDLTTLTPLTVTPGYGPRHAVFYNPNGHAGESETTFLYVVGELSNNVTGFSVTYLPNQGGLSFEKIYESTTYGDAPVPAGNAAAEIQLSHDNRFMVISNRNNSQFTIPDPDSKTGATLQSDTLSTFALSPSGQLIFQDVVPCGGLYPRHFSMNKEGSLVAVGLQYAPTGVVLLERDVPTGKIGKTVAWYPIEGNVTCVRWNQPVFDGTNSNLI